MPKSENQKLKLFYILKLLQEHTDEEHRVTTQDIIDYLGRNDIKAERKSIYTDMELLEEYGFDIVKLSQRPNSYYLASRQFELAELKLLVDSVQASKFITPKKSRELIGKLETLCSKYEAKQLHRQVVVADRIKTVNENIYYNVDFIHKAIAEDVKIRFQYLEWSVKKEMQFRRDGAMYEVSPWLLTWGDENYYLIAFDEEAGIMKHYRVDKMLNTELSVDKRQGKGAFEKFDIAAYSKKIFGMFAGEEEVVNLLCDASLTGVLVDRFGQDVSLRQMGDNQVRVRVKVAVSRQFFGWLTGLGRGVKVESPESVAEEYRNYLQDILNNYTQ